MDNTERSLILVFGVVIGFVLGWGFAVLNESVDPDLRRIQQQRNAWAQYQEAGEAAKP